MKAITLSQPFATLIALDAKTIETRSWATTYRGPLAIHAAAGLGPVGGVVGLRQLVAAEPFRTTFDTHDAHWGTDVVGDPSYYLSRGAIVAVCRVCAVTHIEQIGVPEQAPGYWMYGRSVWTGDRVSHHLTDQERAFGDYSPGRYAFLLADIRALSAPIPCRGAIGLWTVPPATLAQIEAAL